MSDKLNRCHCGGLRHKHDIERIAQLEADLAGYVLTHKADWEHIEQLENKFQLFLKKNTLDYKNARIAEVEAENAALREQQRWATAAQYPDASGNYLAVLCGVVTILLWDGLHWFDLYDSSGLAHQPTRWMHLPAIPQEQGDA
jgi:hypothetical protein